MDSGIQARRQGRWQHHLFGSPEKPAQSVKESGSNVNWEHRRRNEETKKRRNEKTKRRSGQRHHRRLCASSNGFSAVRHGQRVLYGIGKVIINREVRVLLLIGRVPYITCYLTTRARCTMTAALTNPGHPPAAPRLITPEQIAGLPRFRFIYIYIYEYLTLYEYLTYRLRSVK